jgi:hypothetical protein
MATAGGHFFSVRAAANRKRESARKAEAPRAPAKHADNQWLPARAYPAIKTDANRSETAMPPLD